MQNKESYNQTKQDKELETQPANNNLIKKKTIRTLEREFGDMMSSIKQQPPIKITRANIIPVTTNVSSTKLTSFNPNEGVRSPSVMINRPNNFSSVREKSKQVAKDFVIQQDAPPTHVRYRSVAQLPSNKQLQLPSLANTFKDSQGATARSNVSVMSNTNSASKVSLMAKEQQESINVLARDLKQQNG